MRLRDFRTIAAVVTMSVLLLTPAAILAPPGGNQPGDKQPGGNQPGDKQPGGNPQGDNPQGDKQPGGNPPGDKQPGDNPQGDKQPGGKQPGGKQPGGNNIPMAECAPGTIPTRAAPCIIPPCPTGVAGTKTSPCMPDYGGPNGQGDQGGQGAGPMSAPPPAELTKNTFTMNVEIEGSGVDPSTFEASLVKVVRGVKKEARAFMSEQFEGESFIITAGKAKCFADSKKDPGLVPDEVVPCKTLADLVDNVAGSINATFTGKMVFDEASFTPSFKAKKIVMRGKSFKF